MSIKNSLKSITIVTLLLILPNVITNANEKVVGISRLFDKSQIVDREIKGKLEDIIVSSFANLEDSTKLSLNILINYDTFKNGTYNKDEIINLDYLIIPEILSYSLDEETNFYDELLIDYRIKATLRVILIELKNGKTIDDTDIEVDVLSKQNLDDAKNLFFDKFSLKSDKYFDELTLFKSQIGVTKRLNNFLYLSKGIDANLKVGNILCYYDSSQMVMKEHTLIRIVKVEAHSSIANIIFNTGDIPEDALFIIQSKSHIEIQLAGGFSIGNLTTDNLSLNPNANFRLILPVGIPYFNPLFEAELNFFYKNAKLLLPFSFLTGVEAKFNIYRYEITNGLLFGVFFSPDLDYSYKLDSAVVKPYLRNSVILTSVFKLFFEFGFKKYINDNFNREWKLDLTGVYLLFGVSIYL